ncbi:MAG: Rrf2 family transcriptional regulator [Coriobacteriales bacterium]|jgi:Rrf2 family protein|nr:Rrf2 family transcriptional regulator [Coriobacteriales bacterium]
MKTSSKARYALYLMTDIARHEHAGPVSLREVSIRQSISSKYLEHIASNLSKFGYLLSVRGAQGGYKLAQDATDISAGDIMRAAEGGFLPVACLGEKAQSCPRQSRCCGVAGFWQGLRSTVDDYIDNVSLAELATDVHAHTHANPRALRADRPSKRVDLTDKC